MKPALFFAAGVYLFLLRDYFGFVLATCIGNPTLMYVYVVPIITFLLLRDAQQSIYRENGRCALLTPVRALLMTAYALLIYTGERFINRPEFGMLAFPVGVFLLVRVAYDRFAGPLAFPCFFLVFFYPFEHALARFIPTLIHYQTAATGWFLQSFGFSVTTDLENHRLIFVSFTLNIVPECSGLNLLILITMFTSLFANYSRLDTLGKWVLALSAIPAALFANIFRIASLGVVGSMGYWRYIDQWVHSLLIMPLLALTFLVLTLEKKLLLRARKPDVPGHPSLKS